MDSKRMQINSWMNWGRQCKIWEIHWRSWDFEKELNRILENEKFKKSKWTKKENEILDKSDFKNLVESLITTLDEME